MAVVLSRELKPDVVIMDISMKGLNGIEATRQIIKNCPDTKIIALSIHSEKHYVEDMLRAGASGYILKESIPEDLIRGIKAVMNGEGYLSPFIVGIVISRYHDEVFPTPISATNSNVEPKFKPASPLMQTKLHQPEQTTNHLHRPRLLQELDNKRYLALHNIVAPAGYGKSSLISCWLNQIDWHSAWYSLDKTDNDLRQFLRYFIHALQKIFPDSLNKMSDIISSPNLPPSPVLVNLLVNGIQEIKQHFIFVLDDFHEISDSSIHELLSSVLRYPPNNMHLVIISRKEPMLSLSIWRVQDKINEININDLRFTESETKEFLQRVTNKAVTNETSAYWTQRTEGWITALHLAVLAMSQKNNMTDASDSSRIDTDYIMEYFNSEVIVQQEPEIQKLLMYTSILNRFCAPLCDALFSNNEKSPQLKINGKVFIDKLHRNNLFLIDLDNDHAWFRYHHLFQTLLYNQLFNNYSQNDILQLHSHASHWFESQNLIEEAVEHAVKSKDLRSAVNIIERHRHEEHEKMWWDIEKWLKYLPDQVQSKTPGLLLARAWIFHDHFNLSEMSLVIQRLEDNFTDNFSDKTALGELRLFQGILKYWQGKAKESLKLIQEAQSLIPQKLIRITRIIDNYIAVATQMTGHGEEILQAINKRLRDNQYINKDNTIILFISKSFVEMLSGNHTMAAKNAHNLNDISDASLEPMPTGWINYFQAMSYFKSNRLKEAIPYFSLLVEQRYHMITRASIDAIIGLALTYQAMNRSEECQETIKQLKEYSKSLNDPQLLQLSQSAIARLALTQGKLSSAKYWLESFEEQMPISTMFVWLENPSITKARVLVAIGSDDSLQQACKLLETIKAELEILHNTCQIYEIIPLLALGYYKQNHIDKALNVLKEMINRTNSNHWLQVFIEPGPLMKEMLLEILNEFEDLNKIESSYIKNILTSFVFIKSIISSDPVSLNTEQIMSQKYKLKHSYLTTREIQILILLKQRYSNKEISSNLFISIETVKSHLKKIFTKLEVSHRKDAVEKATELGLYT
jgi:LuxR family maltose regulon positive regulatory protein